MSLTDSLLRLPGGLLPGQRPVADTDPGILERLKPCLPGPFRRYLANRDRRLMVIPEGHSARLLLESGETSDLVGTFELVGHDPLPAAASGIKEGRRRNVIRLPAEAVLTRLASFPAQVRDNLPQVIGYELSRLSPFNPDQVFHTFTVMPGAKGDQRIAVKLALCRRDRVEAWIKRLSEAGAPVDELSWDGAWPKANLLPQKERRRNGRPLLDSAKLLFALMLMLLAAVLVTPLWQRAQILDALETEVRQARGDAIQVDDLRQELERARQGSIAVLQQKFEQPRVIDLLRELTELIPEETWIQSMELRDGEVQLRGESAQATGLIATLESAPGIDNVSFRSPLTQVARTGKERFNLAFTYKREPEQ